MRCSPMIGIPTVGLLSERSGVQPRPRRAPQGGEHQVQMSPMSEEQGVPGKRAAQGRATRSQLIEVATGLFAEQGYEGTPIEAGLNAAGVSRGALYHHFAGKEALFTAVLEALTERITARQIEIISGCTDP